MRPTHRSGDEVVIGPRGLDAETAGDLPLSVRQFLEHNAGRIDDAYIAGGTAAVSTKVRNQIADALSGGSADLSRLSGPDRYATAAVVADRLFHFASHVTVATGDNWPDGVTGGVLAHPALTSLGAPILLTPAAGNAPALHPATAAYLRDHDWVNRGYLLGLQAAVSFLAQDQFEDCLQYNAGRQPSSYCRP